MSAKVSTFGKTGMCLFQAMIDICQKWFNCPDAEPCIPMHYREKPHDNDAYAEE